MPVSLATFVCVLVARCQRVRRFMAPETGPIFQLERSVITSVLHAVQFDLIGIASFPSAISPILLYTRACKHSCTCPHDSRKFTGAYTHTQTHRNQMCQGKQHSGHFQLQVSLPTQPPPLATHLVIKSVCSHCSLFSSYFDFTRLITHAHTHTHTCTHLHTYIHTYFSSYVPFSGRITCLSASLFSSTLHTNLTLPLPRCISHLISGGAGKKTAR